MTGHEDRRWIAHPWRLAAGLAVAVAATLAALIFGGPSMGFCMGPLGVTAVQCAAHGGNLPTTGALPAMVVVSCAAGVLVVWRVERSRLDLVVGGCAALLGALAYELTRPTVLEGPDVDGTWLSLPMPSEPWSLASWALAGAALALLVVPGARRVRSRGRGSPARRR